MASTLRESAAFATARTKRIENEMLEAGLLPTQAPTQASSKKASTAPGPRDSTTSLASNRPKKRLCAHRQPFDDTLEVMKFICKDVWVALFDKQVDNLRTNRRGMFQLSDAMFKPILRVSSYLGRPETIRKAKLYATFPAGIVRGILSTMGYSGTVVPEITAVPQCTLKVNIKLPKSEMSGAV
ncbi:hypothetical protein MD484_g4778, partial [Candolleomyces efflorescens]